jgi:hypothetical protein
MRRGEGVRRVRREAPVEVFRRQCETVRSGAKTVQLKATETTPVCNLCICTADAINDLQVNHERAQARDI